jgi:predicted dehydrogenase
MVGYPEVERLTCHMSAGDHEVEDAAVIMARTTNGITVTLEVSNKYYSGSDRQYARVLGSEGSGELLPLEVFKQLGGRPLEVTPRQPRPQGGENPYMNAYRRQIDSFVRSVQGTSDIEMPSEQVGLMRVIEAAYRSAEEGTEVVL